MTNGRIHDVLDKNAIRASTKMMLMSIVNFKDEWLHEFESEGSEPFYFGPDLENSSNITVMKQKGQYFLYGNCDKLHVSVLGVPYKDRRLYYFVLLPDNDTDLMSVEESLDADHFVQLIKNTTKRNVHVRQLTSVVVLSVQYYLRTQFFLITVAVAEMLFLDFGSKFNCVT